MGDILDKLRKLKAHQESAAKIGSIKEAEAFAEKIQALLLDHRLTMSDLEFKKFELDEPIETEVLFAAMYGLKDTKYRESWLEQLAQAVALAHFCQIMCHSGTNRVTFVGRKMDREAAIFVFTYLANVGRDLADAEWKDYPNKSHGGAWTFKKSFLTGFWQAIDGRFKAERERTTQVNQVTNQQGLILVSRSSEAVKLYMRVTLKTRQGSRIGGGRTDVGGYERGRERGNQVELRGRVIESGKPSLQIKGVM